tara:strand:- start:532 stop:864 length:333 start_codon:yes stop_codon:yes gene_type:complete
MQTKFNKEDFTWDGMYLMYKGNFDGAQLMTDVHPDCHPSWKGMLKPAFVARFKYGYKPWKAWVNFLVKNATVEKYMELADHRNMYMSKYGYETNGSPAHAMEALGYKGKK